MGRISMPSWRIGTSRYEKPVLGRAGGSVRASTKHQSAQWASEVHTFWPWITHSSPSSSARVCDVGQVAAGVGLGVALAPQLGAGHDRRQEAPLLLGGAEGDQRRAEQRLADVADPARAGPGRTPRGR